MNINWKKVCCVLSASITFCFNFYRGFVSQDHKYEYSECIPECGIRFPPESRLPKNDVAPNLPILPTESRLPKNDVAHREEDNLLLDFLTK